MSIIDKIIKVDFPVEQYVPRVTEKKQIVLHHTVSPSNSVKGDIATWLRDKKRIATCMIIDEDGIPFQCFSSKYWAWHLGIKKSVFTKLGLEYELLDDNAIGIEIDSAGGLTKRGGEWYDVYNHKLNDSDVIEYPDGYRGYKGFQRYTDAQIESVRELLVFWHERYEIPLDYNEDMWDVSIDALKGKSGVWSHSSYRKDKSDIHPQPELIKMLKSLDTYYGTPNV